VAQCNLGVMYENGYGGLPKDDVKAVEWYHKAAEQGHALAQKNLKSLADGWLVFSGDKEAQFVMGKLYFEGKGFVQDKVEATKYFGWSRKQYQPLAENPFPSPHAQYRLGMMYERGYGVDASSEEAIKQYSLAVRRGSKEAKESLIGMADKQADVQAQWILGCLYLEGAGVVEREERAAVEWLLRAASQGHDGALRRLIELGREGERHPLQYALGQLYEEGKGIEKNYQEAVLWYELSAKTDKADAPLRLGLLYESGGYGIEKDEKTAVNLYWLAAAHSNKTAVARLIALANEQQGNYPEAQYVLGDLYLKGEGVEKNYQAGIAYWLQAARQGHKLSLARIIGLAEGGDINFCYGLGLLYEKGTTSVNPDTNQAVEWFFRAARAASNNAQALDVGGKAVDRLINLGNSPSHHPAAHYSLGRLYENEVWVQHDYTKAIEWYRLAVMGGNIDARDRLMELANEKKNNHPQAQYVLGELYCEGSGIEREKQKGVTWLYQAACQGHQEAIARLTTLAEAHEPQAQYRMGLLYRDDVIAIDKPHKAAEMWFEQAKENLKADVALKRTISALSESIKAKAYAERFYADIFPALNSAHEQTLVLVVGRTGAGKSTLINRLLGHKFEYVINDKGEWSMKVTNASKNALKLYAEMGQGRSTTRAPRLFPVTHEEIANTITLCDLPGFSDTESNRRKEHRFHLALLLSGMAKAITAVLVVIDCTSLEEGQGEGCKALLSELDEIMNDTHVYQQCVFVVNMKGKSQRGFTSKQLVDNSLQILIRVFNEDLISTKSKEDKGKLERKIALLEKIKESALIWESFDELDFPRQVLGRLNFKEPIRAAFFRPMLQEAAKQTYLSYLNQYVSENFYQPLYKKSRKGENLAKWRELPGGKKSLQKSIAEAETKIKGLKQEISAIETQEVLHSEEWMPEGWFKGGFIAAVGGEYAETCQIFDFKEAKAGSVVTSCQMTGYDLEVVEEASSPFVFSKPESTGADSVVYGFFVGYEKVVASKALTTDSPQATLVAHPPKAEWREGVKPIYGTKQVELKVKRAKLWKSIAADSIRVEFRTIGRFHPGKQDELREKRDAIEDCKENIAQCKEIIDSLKKNSHSDAQGLDCKACETEIAANYQDIGMLRAKSVEAYRAWKPVWDKLHLVLDQHKLSHLWYAMGQFFLLSEQVYVDEIDPCDLSKRAEQYENEKNLDKAAECYYVLAARMVKHSQKEVPLITEALNKLHTLAAEAGNRFAQFRLAAMYKEGNGVKQNDNDAFRFYELAARQNHPEGQFNVGQAYRDGWGGVQADTNNAFEWYAKAAVQGHRNALKKACEMYRKITPRPIAYKDLGEQLRHISIILMLDPDLHHYSQARIFLKEAVRFGDKAALFYLGLLNQYGLGLEKPHLRAAFFFYERSDNLFPVFNILRAIFCLGRVWDIDSTQEEVLHKVSFYLDSVVETPRVYREREYGLEMAFFEERVRVNKNDITAILFLGFTYKLGLPGVKTDKRRAEDYLMNAVQLQDSVLGEYPDADINPRGYVAAIQYYISLLYQKGKVFEESEIESRRWHEASSRNGYYLLDGTAKTSKRVIDFKIPEETLAPVREGIYGVLPV
jgi:TPR repeat protein/GTP-binding protein EngB required for normal cell division